MIFDFLINRPTVEQMNTDYQIKRQLNDNMSNTKVLELMYKTTKDKHSKEKLKRSMFKCVEFRINNGYPVDILKKLN